MIFKDPQKNPVCYSFIDRYDNVISEEKCEESKFCSGTCSNRYCGQSEQHWLDQDKCQNNIGVKTTQVDTTEVETTSTDRPPFSTTTDSGIEPLFRIKYYYYFQSTLSTSRFKFYYFKIKKVIMRFLLCL